jgi:hypothetical protein
MRLLAQPVRSHMSWSPISRRVRVSPVSLDVTSVAPAADYTSGRVPDPLASCLGL